MVRLAPSRAVRKNRIVLVKRLNLELTKSRALNWIICFVGKYKNQIIERQDKRALITQKSKASSFRSGEKPLTGGGPILQDRMMREELNSKAEGEHLSADADNEQQSPREIAKAFCFLMGVAQPKWLPVTAKKANMPYCNHFTREMQSIKKKTGQNVNWILTRQGACAKLSCNKTI